MNRAGRQRARVRLMRGVTDLEQAIRCPDCDSHVAIVELAPGIYQGRVEHDDTCQWYAALKADLGRDR